MINEFAVSGFSSNGPSADNRIKPDVMAIGSGAYVITSDGRIVNKSGTSFTSPQVAGLAAALWQAYPDLSALEIVEAMRFSANNSANPDNEKGFGIPSYQALVNYVEHFTSTTWASIYPNPTADDLNVYVNNPAEDSKVDFKLFNTNGQPILKANFDITWQDNRYILDVSTLPRGIYVLNLYSKENFSQLKFAKL
jgi:serine protease AprX